MTEINKNNRKQLIQNSDERTSNSAKIYFKEKISFYGVKNATVHKIAKNNFNSIKDKPKSTIFALCEILFKSGYFEE